MTQSKGDGAAEQNTSEIDPVRRDTARVFGAYCHYLRVGERISAEGMSHRFTRTESWIAALECGEFTPTYAMAAELDDYFKLEDSNGFRSLLVELESQPYGDRATSIRERYNLPPFNSDADNEQAMDRVGEGMLPLVNSIRARDRILITGPIAFVVVLLISQISLMLWARDALAEAAVPIVAGLLSFAIMVMTLALTALERLLSRLGRWTRPKRAKDHIADVQLFRKASGLHPTYPGCWFQDDEEQHLLPAKRDVVAESCTLTDFAERQLALLWINLVAGLGFTAFAGYEGRAAANPVAAFAILALGFMIRHSVNDSASRASDGLNEGLGFVDPAKPPLSASSLPSSSPSSATQPATER